MMRVASAEHIVVHGSPVWGDRAKAVLRAVVPNPPDGEEWFEQLWAAPVSAGRYELCCIPFATYDYALGDVVEVGSGEMEYAISGVAQPSGRVVLRVWLADSARETWDELQGLIRFRGLLFEFRKPALVAIDVVDEVTAVTNLFEESSHCLRVDVSVDPTALELRWVIGNALAARSINARFDEFAELTATAATGKRGKYVAPERHPRNDAQISGCGTQQTMGDGCVAPNRRANAANRAGRQDQVLRSSMTSG